MRLRTLAFAATILLGLAAVAAAGSPSPLVLVLDASGSMWGQVHGEAKIVGARRVIGELAAGLEAGRSVGLVAYGHRRASDCADIETVSTLAPLDLPLLKRLVDQLNPRGKTPITAAIEHALALAPPGATVVVVTDGLETCGGDPCAAVRAARQRGGDFLLHVVGLDVGDEDVSSLECSAQAGGGLYLPATDAAGLAEAMGIAVALPPSLPSGALVLGAVRNGALQDVAVRIESLGQQRPALVARTYAGPETNPRTIPLADGNYRATVRPVGIDAATDQVFEFTIANGASVERSLDYSTGELSIGATRNGTLSDVTWQVFAAGDRSRALATGRTYRSPSSNPHRTTLPIGHYEVVLHALEIGGRPSVELGRVHVTTQGTSVQHDFASGELALGVVRGDILVDATVAVRANRESVHAGRTYRSAASNPLRFTLAPGDYEVEIGEIGGGKHRLGVTIEAGGTVTRTLDLAQETPDP